MLSFWLYLSRRRWLLWSAVIVAGGLVALSSAWVASLATGFPAEWPR